MDINALLLMHGRKTFQVDAEDELGVFMHLGDYKIHMRKDDYSLIKDMSIHEFHPLINSFKKI